MHICAVIKEKVLSLQTEHSKYVFKRDLNDDNDGAHLTSLMEMVMELVLLEVTNMSSVLLSLSLSMFAVAQI